MGLNAEKALVRMRGGVGAPLALVRMRYGGPGKGSTETAKGEDASYFLKMVCVLFLHVKSTY